ncbi:MAG: hypothetical protein GC192_21250 [Bacteroidetes bacterium]|nr:hypothetical protein [Bacteroidota bacterium]
MPAARPKGIVKGLPRPTGLPFTIPVEHDRFNVQQSTKARELENYGMEKSGKDRRLRQWRGGRL